MLAKTIRNNSVRYCLQGALVAALFVFALIRPIAAQEKVMIGVSGTNFSFLPFQVADELGFFKKQGLQVQRVLMTVPVAVAALHSDNIDYSAHLNGLIQGAIRGFKMRVIFSTANQQMFSFVAQPEIRSPQDLKGKTIGVSSFGAFHHVLTARVLKAVGLDPEKDVTILGVGNEHIRVQQLKSKHMHGTFINPPMSILLKNEGFRLLFNAADYVSVPLTGLGTTTKKLAENPEQVKKVLRALYESLRFIRDNKAATVKISSRWLKMDPQVASDTYDLAINSLSIDGTVSDDGIMTAIEIASEGAKVSKQFAPTDVTDFSLLKTVIKEYSAKH